MDEFISKEPGAALYFRPWYGAQEFINREPRYCLYVAEVNPSELRKMPLVIDRINKVRLFRLNSRSKGTVDLAQQPTKFHVTNVLRSTYLLIPRVSSERREWVPVGFMNPQDLCSDATIVMPDATLYHFGVLTSSTHMAWMRTVAGRLEMRYRYSKDIVYNNFPWPEQSKESVARIKKTAHAILDARENYSDRSYADLYDPLFMPPDLRKAHQANDRAVWEAYGKPWPFEDEPACVAHLMQLYQQITIQNPY